MIRPRQGRRNQSSRHLFVLLVLRIVVDLPCPEGSSRRGAQQARVPLGVEGAKRARLGDFG